MSIRVYKVYAHGNTRIRVLEFAYFAYVLVRLFSSGTVRVNDHEIKIAPYADDTTVFVRDKELVLELLEFLREFSSLSRFRN